ncbi:MAG: hypothetical protein ACKO81_05580 [Planctomycetota bacterium]
MVDTETWNKLDDAARAEFRSLLESFQRSLQERGVLDGQDLAADWTVQLFDGVWVISNAEKALEGVNSPRREVIEALYRDGVQNLNR